MLVCGKCTDCAAGIPEVGQRGPRATAKRATTPRKGTTIEGKKKNKLNLLSRFLFYRFVAEKSVRVISFGLNIWRTIE